MGKFKNYLSDSSSASLLFSNIFVIFLAIIQSWEVSTVLWVYWMQSIIIGFFQFLRILSLRNFSTDNFKINGQPASPTQSTKLFTALFFAFHYGFFHFIYAIFLASVIAKAPESLSSVLVGSSIFFLNHLFSFIKNKAADEAIKPNIGKLMFTPYARIIPMHLIIIFGAILGQSMLIVFLIIKTITDLVLHSLKHHQSDENLKVSKDLLICGPRSSQNSTKALPE